MRDWYNRKRRIPRIAEENPQSEMANPKFSMAIAPSPALRIGEWRADPETGEISRGSEVVRLDFRAMRLLLFLARNAPQIVSIDELLNETWTGVAVSPDSVYQTVASLRRQLGDDAREPRYIETVPRIGYRMVATVRPWTHEVWADEAPQQAAPQVNAMQTAQPLAQPTIRGTWLAGAAAATICVMVLAILVFGSSNNRKQGSGPPVTGRTAPQNSVAVLPLLDLTEGMHSGEFADGITEELVDKLSRIPALKVPGATSSFYFKDKQPSIAEVARSLNVAYVLDGSVRKSQGWVRVDVRLVRADNAYIVWSATYDRPMKDLLSIQDDIAGKVASALNTSIGTQSGQAQSQ
jgi:TolB-like protein/DNA-binding winged helix-turn-helix (wHTH) protein